MTENPKIVLKPKRDAALKRFHPWVFSGAIATEPKGLSDGALVDVCAHDGSFLAVGHYQKGSISVRVLSYEPTAIDEAFWIQKITAAQATRSQIHFPTSLTNAYRLVHAAGDGLPGLIVDIYDRVAVIQCHSIGMHRQRDLIAGAIRTVLGDRIEAVYDKSQASLPDRYALKIADGYLLGEGEVPVAILEHGMQFSVDWVSGQKTGFFLDQRANRQLLRQYVAGKSVLNLFCYTGGFSVAALKGGATSVTSVDLSEPAIEQTIQHVEQNDLDDSQHTAIGGDVLGFLKDQTDVYDVIVVDPPAYAKHPGKRHKAVQAYKRLNAMAIRRLRPGGLLFTFSCSGVVDTPLFRNTIVAAALEAGRPAKILHQLSQDADHPVLLFHPEGHYLKGLVLEV